jgi:hypothetical protein
VRIRAATQIDQRALTRIDQDAAELRILLDSLIHSTKETRLMFAGPFDRNTFLRKFSRNLYQGTTSRLGQKLVRAIGLGFIPAIEDNQWSSGFGP